MTAPTENGVRTQAVDGVLLVTIDRPRVRNAVDLPVAQALADAMDRLDGDRDLRVGVLTGAGRTFSSGMDLKAFAAGQRPIVEGRGFAGLVQRPPQKPLIAAVEGAALAGGLEMVLVCDLVTAGRSAVFGLPEVRRGLIAAGGGLLRLPQRIPYHHAMELALLGDTFTAEQAHDLGLVNRLVDDGEALPAAMDLARRICANGPLAVEASKRVIATSAGWPEDERFGRQELLADPVRTSHDAAEGARAFLEKRPPVWTGA